MKLKYLLAEAMQNEHTDEVLTAVGDALVEVTARNLCSRNLTEEKAQFLNKPFSDAAVLVFQARNVFRNFKK